MVEVTRGAELRVGSRFTSVQEWLSTRINMLYNASILLSDVLSFAPGKQIHQEQARRLAKTKAKLKTYVKRSKNRFV